MESEPNQAGGENLWVLPEDELSEVPDSHRGLLTQDIRDAFENPQRYLLKLAVDTTLPAFAEYLNLLIKEARCALLLATADEMFGGSRAAFHWWPRGRATIPHRVFIEPGECDPPGLCCGRVSAVVFTSPLGALGGIRVRRWAAPPR